MNNTDILNKDNSGKALDFLIDELKHILREDQIAINEPMRNHTTFRIGDNAIHSVLVNVLPVRIPRELAHRASYPLVLFAASR